MYKLFVTPSKIILGEGAINSVIDLLKEYGARRPMIFADPGIIAVGIVKKFGDSLINGSMEYKIYSDLLPEPPIIIGQKALNNFWNGSESNRYCCIFS